MSEVGCAERTPSEARSADDLYIGVRSALIYQKLRDFRVKINKVKLCEIEYNYTKRFLPFFRKKACEKIIINFTCVKSAWACILVVLQTEI